MGKVFLGVGHGGNDVGAVSYLVEKDVNLTMALACRDYLVANGVEVKMSRTKDENDSLNEEINECNAYNPDLAIDIHNNAGGGDGFEAYYHYKGGKGKTLAENIEAEVKTIGQNSRGIKTKLNSTGNADYYGFIRLIQCPSIIVEGLFVDNAKDVVIADTIEEQKAFGVAYAKGILKTLGIVAKDIQQEDPYKTFVKEVQSACGAKVDGIAGSETLSKTVTVSATKNRTHAVIKPIQKYLYVLGYTEVGNNDGIAGTKFTNAVKRYQKENGCVVDGEITARNKTWKKLLRLA